MPLHYIRLITHNGTTAFRTGFVIPRMRHLTVLTAPSLILHIQPFRKALLAEHFEVLKNALPVRILCIQNERLHPFTALHFAAFIAELIAFMLSTSLDATGGAKSGGLYAFAPVTLLNIINFSCFGRQQNWASTAIHATISMQDKIHKLFHLNPIYQNLRAVVVRHVA